MSDDRPPEHKTKEIPVASPVEIALRQIQIDMKSGFRETNANIDLLSGDLNAVKADVRSLQAWKGEQETRASTLSTRVRGMSQVDLRLEAEAADVVIRQKKLEEDAAETRAMAAQAVEKAVVIEAKTDAQTLILQQLLKLTEKPMVKLIATAIGTALLTWLGTKGLR